MKKRLIYALAAALVFAAALSCHMWMLRELPEGRVEILAPDFPSAERALIPVVTERGWKPVPEGDRLVICSQSPFAAPAIRAALTGADIDAQVIDYTWTPAVAAQSGVLWMGWGTVWGIWLLWSLFRAFARKERDRAQSALNRQYLAQYLFDAGVRLLAEAIAVAVGVIVIIMAMRWLWHAEPALPPDLLPESSLFNPAHYCRWAQNTFPDGLCSSYSGVLVDKMRLSYTLAAIECGALTTGAMAIRSMIKIAVNRPIHRQFSILA